MRFTRILAFIGSLGVGACVVEPADQAALEPGAVQRSGRALDMLDLGGATGPEMAAAPSSAANGEPWTLIVVPDTQHYTDRSSNVSVFITQMQWIADNVAARNIAFVTHLGDVVQHGDRVIEWDRAEQAMGILDGVVPYSVAIGDHDYVDEERRSSGAPEYIARYGAARYQGYPWYGGASPDQKSHYQYFTAGGRTFLHLTLEWEAPGTVDDPSSALGWGKQVLDANPYLPTIISTHSYIWDKPGEKGRTNGIEEDDGDGASGEQIWSALVASSPQVFMLLNGNFHKETSQYDASDPSADPAGPSLDGEYHQVSTNLHGLPVYEMLSNYQDYPNGGDGWIRVLTFEEGAGAGGLDRIRVQTYSTLHDAYQTDAFSQFHFDLSFAERFDAIPAPLPLQRATFTTGDDAYVWQKNGSLNRGRSSNMLIDTEDDGEQQGLMRFDIDFGGSIPAGAEIVRAELQVALSDPGNGFAMHRMLVPWDEDTVTWNSLGGGVDPDGSDAVATPDLVTIDYMSKGESRGYSLFDVTESVRAWAAGQSNRGWALLPLGPNKLVFDSFQGSMRPRLVVDYLPPPGSGQVTAASGEDTYIWRKEPQSSFGASDRIRVDRSDGYTPGSGLMPMQGLIRFDIESVVPAGVQVTHAKLRLRLTDSGHGFALHRMLVPWSESTATWNTFDEGIGGDGVEAMATPDIVTDSYLTEPSTPTYLDFDVTGAVQTWTEGQANHGWALLPLGDDKLIIESFQGSELTPELVIDYITP